MKLGRNFLPVSIEDMKNQSIDELDFIIVTGDAYVDHPSFGTAIIGRTLEYNGYKVGIIPQPNWKDVEAFKVLGRPKLGFLVNSGNIDSMVNHYSVSKRKRREDLYSPGGEPNHRPDRAVIVYCNMIRQAYKDVPIIIGGIEASLRRFAHYDYWDDKIRRSVLLDSKADLLIYGMGEKTVVQIADLLKYGMNIKNLTHVRGTCYMSKDLPDNAKDYVTTPCFEEIEKSKSAYNESYKLEYYEQDPVNGRGVIQQYGDRYLIANRPQEPLTEEEMDISYNLPYMRTYHPMYEEKGGIPAIQEVKFSITSHRGCFGSCAFCALTFHQGRIIQHRSEDSIVDEAKLLTTLKDFKGYIHDIGGPTANFRNMACKKQETHGACRNKQCMFPTPCKNLKIDHTDYLHILRRVRALPGIKKVFVRSGIRYDYLIHDKNTEFFNDLCKYHISGQLKVAPEHISDKVLLQMGKPSREVYDKFRKKYFEINKKVNKNQFLVPYLMSSHPGSDLKAAIELSQYIKKMGHNPEQVQDFYPTPGSLATTIYYTGINPLTGEKVYVPKSPKEKAMQRALLQFEVPENYNLVKDALLKAGREDLIGNGKDCLIPFNPPSKKNSPKKYEGKNNRNSSNRNSHSSSRGSHSSRNNVKGKSKRH